MNSNGIGNVRLSTPVRSHLEAIYNENIADSLTPRVLAAMGVSGDTPAPAHFRNNWNESDTILITYGNTVQQDGELPLHTLDKFLQTWIRDNFSIVHILPFFPFSSDDGFSVMDFVSVNPSLGDWPEIQEIGKHYQLMADLVINHVSSRSKWFDDYQKQQAPGKDYFIEASPEDDHSTVVRPRNTPLLNPVKTKNGERHVWCTFSADQVDLNFRNPEVLLEMVKIIRFYLDKGVRVFRLDAVAFLWKEPGTSCIHLPQTHEIIRLLRLLIESHCPDAIVICECNVPNRENLTYFGNANEAHVIYNFSLPPLLLYTLLSGDCRHLKTWMMSMPPAQAGTTYLNFIASHDGIGLRPLDGLLEDNERTRLVAAVEKFGGKVTLRRAREGHDKPYELNVALLDALSGTIDGVKDEFNLARFYCAHTIMLALEGIPAFYIQSMLGSRNDHRRMEHTGRFRSINRHIWQYPELEKRLKDQDEETSQVFNRLTHLIAIRRQQPAFHPNATQFTLHLGTSIFAFWRQSTDRRQSIFCINNVSNTQQAVSLGDINLIGTDDWHDLISGKQIDNQYGELLLAPYESAWISNLGMPQTHN